MKINPLTMTDFYKTDHRKQYPVNTTMVYSNFTPRSSRLASNVTTNYDNKVVFFGLQGFIKSFLQECFNENFFNRPKQEVIAEYKRRLDTSLGPDSVSMDHIEALHDLGYLPVEIKAVPEGSRVNVRVPMFTIKNTHPDFYWVTNFLESVMSAELWKPCTTATVAYEYYKTLEKWAKVTGSPLEFIPFQGHDFSFRGLSGMHDASASSAGHLLSFVGTDTIPAIDYLENYYNANAEKELIGCSVPACYDKKTEVLTEVGFIPFKDLNKNTKVAQYHTDGTIDFIVPTEYYDMPYNGDMIQWYKNGYQYINLLVTPNHKMVKFNKDKQNISLFEAGDFSYKTRNGYSNRSCVLVSGRTKSTNTTKLSSLDKLRIAYQADGSLPSRQENYKSGQIRFSIKKERKINRLKEILSDLNLEFSASEPDNRGYVSFWIKTNDNLFDKDFSWVNLDNSYEWYTDFINELQYWDGSQKNNCILYYNTNKKAIDKIQAICVISCKKTQLKESLDQRGDRSVLYTLCIQNDKIMISGNKVKRKTVPYNDRVYCVSVPTKMLIVRRNGVVSVCGNTEHSVMCMGGKEDEIDTFRRLITQVYPSGIVSIVSDTWDFWQVITDFTVKLKEEILNRKPNALGLAKTVFRPDSGDPVEILCGKEFIDFNKFHTLEEVKSEISIDNLFWNSDEDKYLSIAYILFQGKYYKATSTIDYSYDDYYINNVVLEEIERTPEQKGAVECLWEIFGGTTTENGFRVLHERVGLIYGDSITLKRADEILRRLAAKGFAANNVVFGIGSYTYQYCTRDTFGFAVKSTYGEVNHEPRVIFKDPKTDSGVKKSAVGLLRVEKEGDDFVLYDRQSSDDGGVLETVFKDGVLVKEQSLSDIRKILRG